MARPIKTYFKCYSAAIQIGVEKDLKNNPNLSSKLGHFKKKFIKWCTRQRFIYENDICDEVKTFSKKFIESRLYNTDIKLWKSIQVAVFKRDNFTCFYCKKLGGILEVDHIKPISKQGTNILSNLTTSCRKCNRQKRNKTQEEFMEWRKS